MIARALFLTALCLLVTCAGNAQAQEAERLKFDEVYKSSGVLGLTFADKVAALSGKTVVMRGFMAPPLKVEADFFVLTREPVALCPFCNSDADWPANIVVVYPADDQPWVDNTVPIEVRGTLEVGPATDSHTGFVSRLRVTAAHFRPIG
jgi:hypothetical protein